MRPGQALPLAALVSLLAAAAAGAQDLKRGQMLYLVQCRACHDLEAGVPHKVGPNLNGVIGRVAGTVPGFKFSDATLKSGISWSAESMDAWLRQPGALIPGNAMAFAGIANDQDRASVVAYLVAASAAK
jgi:cytochrome c